MRIYILKEGDSYKAFTSATQVGDAIGVNGGAIRTMICRKGDHISYGDKDIIRVILRTNTRK